MEAGGTIVLAYVLLIIFVLAIIYFVIQVPIYIAKTRGIKDGELTTIVVLSWCGLVVGVTWFLALIFALVWKPANWVDKTSGAQNNVGALDALAKLGELRDKGLLTEQEFQNEKAKLMKSL